MKTPEEIKKAASCCFDAESCNTCPYIKERCVGITTSPTLIDDMIALIEQLEEQIDLMKIQMQGDCGVCKHKAHDAACLTCLTLPDKPLWEYEGLPGA